MSFLKNLSDKKLVLASKSPRRQKLLREMDLDFETRTKEVDEKFPGELKREEIPMFLAELKAGAFKDELNPNEILITSDTVVCLGDSVMNKPESRGEAIEMLSSLSGKMHTVYTAVTLTSSEKQITFSDATDVYFKKLTSGEIEYYIDQHRPFDKAGAYGIQEWIGYIGIEKIEGSYFTVVGLPVQKLYLELGKF